jgi:hypothetical protein
VAGTFEPKTRHSGENVAFSTTRRLFFPVANLGQVGATLVDVGKCILIATRFTLPLFCLALTGWPEFLPLTFAYPDSYKANPTQNGV